MRKSQAIDVYSYFGDISGTIYGPCLTVVVGMIKKARVVELFLDNGNRIEVPYNHLITIYGD
jgi:hypothetical protein